MKQDIKDQVLEIVRSKCFHDDVIKESTSIREAGIDSLDIVEISIKIDSDFGIHTDTFFDRVTPEKTVRTIIDEVERLVSKKESE